MTRFASGFFFEVSMLKRLCLALGLIGLVSPAFAAGTIPFSLSQQLDELGVPLSGCKLFIIQAGTTSTPQNPYSDSALSLAIANPIVCDAAGRLPQFFLADGTIKVRLTKSTGVNVVTADGIQVIGASSGSGGSSSVDATTILDTGDLKVRYGTGTLTGFVRANGRTIGSVASGATERANADTETLFEYLWDTDANLSVSGGRGLTSAADFAADKTIALPDWRGRAIAGLDDMGATAAGRVTATYFAIATVLGAAGGGQLNTLATNNLPPYTPAGSVTTTAPQNNYVTAAQVDGIAFQAGSTNRNIPGTATVTASNSTGTGTFTGQAQGGTSVPFSLMQPTMLTTIYVKL